jgi:hypothetical protein
VALYLHPNKRVYPKVPGLAAWSENYKWYSCLPLGAVVSSWTTGVQFPAGAMMGFFFATDFRPSPGPTEPLIQRVPGALTSAVKRPGREADNSSPSIAEIKNG